MINVTNEPKKFREFTLTPLPSAECSTDEPHRKEKEVSDDEVGMDGTEHLGLCAKRIIQRKGKIYE